MPNWTANTLELSGSKKATQKFLDMMGDVFDFEKIIPMPDGLDNWRDWSIENWDTKWNACQCKPVEIEEYGAIEVRTLVYRFDTAWSTPEKVIRKVAKDWPDLEVSGGWVSEGYEECGNFYSFGDYD